MASSLKKINPEQRKQPNASMCKIGIHSIFTCIITCADWKNYKYTSTEQEPLFSQGKWNIYIWRAPPICFDMLMNLVNSWLSLYSSLDGCEGDDNVLILRICPFIKM